MILTRNPYIMKIIFTSHVPTYTSNMKNKESYTYKRKNGDHKGIQYFNRKIHCKCSLTISIRNKKKTHVCNE